MSTSKYQKALDAMEKRIGKALEQKTPDAFLSFSEPLMKYKGIGRKLPSDEVFRISQQKAALSAWFLPDDLFEQSMDSGSDSLVLDYLEPLCEKRKTNKIEWLLKKNSRDIVLKDLISSISLIKCLSSHLPPTDHAGEMMREILRGRTYDVMTLSDKDLLDLITALELLSDIPVSKQSIDEPRQKLQGKFLGEYDILLQNYVGRGELVAELHQFLEAPLALSAYDVHVVTGIGGAGKSTLLAKFLHEVRDKELASIAILDFDRPGVDADDKNWLLMEIITQLARQYPKVRTELESIKEEVRDAISNQERLHLKERVESSDLRAQISQLSRARGVLSKIGADKRPWLIVFDTFEEVKSEQKTKTLLSWISAIASELGGVQIKVIMSGRLFDNDSKVIVNDVPARISSVDEFKEDVAAEFLRKLKVPKETIEEIIHDGEIPLRPLELKLLAKLVEDKLFDLDQLKREANDLKYVGKDLFLGVVYRRVLTRIGDLTARKLAYPGLVLRYLTVDVIQNILVPSIYKLAVQAEQDNKQLEVDEEPIGQLPDEEINKSLNELAIRGWLSYRGPNGEVVHQKYLRRSMLKLMIAKDPNKAREIHNAAMEFFRQQDSQQAQAESLYHSLMLFVEDSDDGGFDLDLLRSMLSSIKPDIDDLPNRAAILLQYAETGEVSRHDLALLPLQYFKEISVSTIKKSNRRGTYQESVELVSDKFRRDLDMVEVALEPLFKTVEWKRLDDFMNHYEQNERGSLDVLFYQSFIHPQHRRSVARDNYFKSVLNSYVFKNWKRGMDRAVVSKVAHVAILDVNVVEHRDVLSVLEDYTRRNTREQAKNPSPLRISAINRLRLILPGIEKQFLITPGLINIERKWLNQMSAYLGETKGLIRYVNDLLSDVDLNQLKAKALLSKIDSVRTLRLSFRITINVGTESKANIVKLLRGPDLEFRDPVRYALLDVFKDPGGYDQLNGLIAKILPIHVTDFYDGLFVREMRNFPEKALEDYVELVDRCWALGKLMKTVLKEYPKARKLALVYESYQVWDKTVKKVIARAYDTEAIKEKERIKKARPKTVKKKPTKKKK